MNVFYYNHGDLTIPWETVVMVGFVLPLWFAICVALVKGANRYEAQEEVEDEDA